VFDHIIELEICSLISPLRHGDLKSFYRFLDFVVSYKSLKPCKGWHFVQYKKSKL